MNLFLIAIFLITMCANAMQNPNISALMKPLDIHIINQTNEALVVSVDFLYSKESKNVIISTPALKIPSQRYVVFSPKKFVDKNGIVWEQENAIAILGINKQLFTCAMTSNVIRFVNDSDENISILIDKK